MIIFHSFLFFRFCFVSPSSSPFCSKLQFWVKRACCCRILSFFLEKRSEEEKRRGKEKENVFHAFLFRFSLVVAVFAQLLIFFGGKRGLLLPHSRFLSLLHTLERREEEETKKSKRKKKRQQGAAACLFDRADSLVVFHSLPLSLSVSLFSLFSLSKKRKEKNAARPPSSFLPVVDTRIILSLFSLLAETKIKFFLIVSSRTLFCLCFFFFSSSLFLFDLNSENPSLSQKTPRKTRRTS